MRNQIFLFMVICVSVNSKLISHHAIGQTSTQFNATQLPTSNDNYLQSRSYNDTKTKINSTQNSLNHDLGGNGFATLDNGNILIHNLFFKEKQKHQIETLYIKQNTSNKNKVTNAKASSSCSVQLQRRGCQQGYAYYQQGNICKKCNNPNKELIYCPANDYHICVYYENPSIPPFQLIEATQSQCIQQKAYDPIKKVCYYCPDNFDLYISDYEQGQYCYCTKPNIYKQVKGIKTCQKKQSFIKQNCYLYNNISDACIKCPQNQLMQWDAQTQTLNCSCQPPYKLNHKQGYSKCQCDSKACPKIQNDCPVGHSWCKETAQCMASCPKNTELRFNQAANNCICLCGQQFKVKIKNGVETCQ